MQTRLRIELYRSRGVTLSERWRWRTRCPRNGKVLGRSSEGYRDRHHAVEQIERHFPGVPWTEVKR